MKTCWRCQQEKPLDAFRPHRAQCKSCEAPKHRARARAQYLRNPERTKVYRQPAEKRLRQALSLPEKRVRTEQERATSRLRSQAYRQQHSERFRATVIAWRREHPEQYLAQKRRRRARKMAVAINDFTAQEWQEMLVAYNHRCVYCGRKMQRLTQDHLTPLRYGGNHTKSNIVPACKSCNSKKHLGPPPVPVQPLLL